MTSQTRSWQPDDLTLANSSGVTMPSDPAGRGGFLDDVIVELGYADRDTVDEAVAAARLHGKPAATTLVENGAISAEQLARAVAERNGLPFVNLDEFEVAAGMQHMIGRTEALRYHALPIASVEDGALVVALADPLDSLAVADIGVMTKSELLPVVASAEHIERKAAELAERTPPPPPRQISDPTPPEGEDLDGDEGDGKEKLLGNDTLRDIVADSHPGVEVLSLVDEPEPASPPAALEPPAPLLAEPPVDAEPPAAVAEAPLVAELSSPVADESSAPEEASPAAEPEVDDERSPQPGPPANGSAPATPAVHSKGIAVNLRDRIVDVVEAALDETAGSEIGRLESVLAEERSEHSSAIERLEAQLAEERSEHSSAIERLEAQLAEERSAHASAIERLEAQLAEEREKNAELSALRDDEKTAREEIATALEHTAQELERRESELAAAQGDQQAEHARHTEDIERLRARLAKAGHRADQLEKTLEEIVGTVTSAHSASQRLAALHGKLQSGLESE